MKKLLLAVGVAAAVSGVQSSFADTLRITNGDGAAFDIPINEISYGSNGWALSTSASVVVDGDTTDPTDPDPTDPDPTDPDPTDPDPSDPDPTDPDPVDPDPGACDDAGVACSYNIKTWPNENSREIRVPKSKILASKFTTGSDAQAYGVINFQTNYASGSPRTQLWISNSAGGEPLPGNCNITASFVYNLKWAVRGGTSYCQLQAGTTYYLNMELVNSSTDAVMVRYLK